MGKTWDAYLDMMPTEEDVGNNLGWALRSLLAPAGRVDPNDCFVPKGPPASRELLVPFNFKPERQPTEPTIVTPDGMFREALDWIKDGKAAQFHADVHGTAPCQCTGRRHRMNCSLSVQVRHAVQKLVQELAVRARMRLSVMPANPTDQPIMVDDHDGLAPPTVRFCIVPRDAMPAVDPAGP